MKDLAVALGIKPVYALGHLHAMWHTVLEQQEDGNIQNWSDSFLASAADFEGDPGIFRKALEAIHWLDGGLIHDWLDYAGRYLRGKYAGSNLQRLKEIWAVHHRRYGIPTQNRHKSNKNPSTPTLPNHTLPNHTKPTERESRAQGASRFQKPTAGEVTAYAKSIGFDLDGQHFCDVYEAKGWVVGKTPMKNWKAVVRTWHKNGFSTGGQNAASNGGEGDSRDADFNRRVREAQGLRKVGDGNGRSILTRVRNMLVHESAAKKPD